MRAYVKLPVSSTGHYGKPEFCEGLSKLGYEISDRPFSPCSSDVVVTWNRYSRDEAEIRKFEAVGATNLVVENAWLGPEDKSTHHFAICRGHHNGLGAWHVGPERRPLGGIELKPWRTEGAHILVLPQRGMGERGVRQEKTWLPSVLNRLERNTKRPIMVRHHPGPRPHPPIEFKDCWAVVTWASGAALKAIVEGIPVFYELPGWIGAPSARHGIADLEDCYTGDRGPMLHRLAWATWTREEISEGEPFRWLLQLSS